MRRFREAKRQKSRQASQRHYSRHKDAISARRKKIREAPKQLSIIDEEPLQMEVNSNKFRHRQEKKRLVDQIKSLMPSTPEKRASIVGALAESPTVKSHLGRTNDRSEDAELGMAVLDDIRDALKDTKYQRRNSSRSAMNTLMGMVSGKNVAKKHMKKKLAKTLNINSKRITKGAKHRKSVMHNKTACWTYTERRVRSDAIPKEHKRLAYEFWAAPGNSRPTGNKKDTIRKRLGPNQYCVHFKQILEKTQTEVYNEFLLKYPAIKMGQRTFENCKPFFVVPSRVQDRVTCCCKQHVETRLVFKSCMDYRKKLVAAEPNQDLQKTHPVFSHLTDFVQQTLCPKANNAQYHQKECLERTCTKCGVNDRHFLEGELDSSATANTATWQKFSYVGTGTFSENGKEKKKLVLETLESPVGEMFAHFKKQLESYPAHQFRAAWQNDQLKSLTENLPLNHVVAVHDYSENYSCKQQDQVQSMYFSQAQASIHVTILHRHSNFENDGVDSTEDKPTIITEHLFVISPDAKHDHHAVHECQRIVADYLTAVGCKVEKMHEWTDGCSTQYKSRHCMGDLSYSNADFGYPIIRNYFETSHAKGPQDGAGANLKHMADSAITKRKVVIQNAEDLYKFAHTTLEDIAPARYAKDKRILKRRAFFYVPEHNHSRPHRQFTEVEGNRAIHSVRSVSPNCIETRKLSCYCENCLCGHYRICVNKSYVDEWRPVTMEQENAGRRVTRAEVERQVEPLKAMITPGSVVAIAAADRGEDYYLFLVTRPPASTPEEFKDEHDRSFPKGADIMCGQFFINSAERFTYKLDSKLAAVYSDTIRYIFVQLQKLKRKGKDIYRIDESCHLDILFSL